MTGLVLGALALCLVGSLAPWLIGTCIWHIVRGACWYVKGLGGAGGKGTPPMRGVSVWASDDGGR